MLRLTIPEDVDHIAAVWKVKRTDGRNDKENELGRGGKLAYRDATLQSVENGKIC